MKTEYEKAVEAARDVIYGQSNIKPWDALENLLDAIEAQEPLFLLHTGEVWGDEQDDWDVEPNGQTTVDDYCAANSGKTVGLYPGPHALTPATARALRLADDAAESVICTEGHSPAAYHWVLTHEKIAADPYLEDAIAHLEWRGIARRFEAEDGVTVIFEEQP